MPNRMLREINWEQLTTRMAPYGSGVYAFYIKGRNGRKRILYIGSSWCLRNRIGNHKVRRLLRDIHDELFVQFVRTVDYLVLEEVLIREVKPKYNKQYLLPPAKNPKTYA